MRPVGRVALGDGGAELSSFVTARAASADLGTGNARQLARRGLRRSDGGGDGHTAHYERGAQSGDGWAYRGAKHGLRSPCENCNVQFSQIYPRSVPNLEKRQLWLRHRSINRTWVGCPDQGSAYLPKRHACVVEPASRESAWWKAEQPLSGPQRRIADIRP
jgi:hypothetical protein